MKNALIRTAEIARIPILRPFLHLPPINDAPAPCLHLHWEQCDQMKELKIIFPKVAQKVVTVIFT